MNNKSFCCQGATAQRNGQKPQWESDLTKKCIFDCFQVLKGMKVKSLSNSASDYCGLLGMYEDHRGYFFQSSVLNTRPYH